MNQTNKIIVLVTGVGGPAGINAARLLKGIPDVYVIGCDIDVLAAGQFFVDEFCISPRVSARVEYETWITDVIVKNHVAVFLPTVHEELPVVSSLANSLSCLTVVSPADAIALGDDKVALYRYVETRFPEHTIPWCLLTDWTHDWLADEVQFIKPRQGRGGRGCIKVTKSELAALKVRGEQTNDYIVMQYMPGTEWTVDAYRARNGSMTYVVPRERIGLAGGISIKGKTVRHELLMALTTDLCNQIGFFGPVCVQWRANAAGVPHLLEINPRLSGGLPITVAAGVNPVKAILSEYKGDIPTEQRWEEVTIVGYFEYKKV